MKSNIVSDIRDSIEQSGLIERLTPAHILVVMGVAFLCSIIIYLVYRIFYRGAVYSDNFNLLIILTGMTTAFIIMTISTNLVLSLGMVGALSIVRFRSAIKDPLDIGFLFWAIAAGLTAGAGLYPLALAGTLAIALIYILFVVIGRGKRAFLLVVSYEDKASEKVKAILESQRTKLKSRVKYKGRNELTLQMKSKGNDEELLDSLLAIEGVTSAVMMEYVGE